MLSIPKQLFFLSLLSLYPEHIYIYIIQIKMQESTLVDPIKD